MAKQTSVPRANIVESIAFRPLFNSIYKTRIRSTNGVDSHCKSMSGVTKTSEHGSPKAMDRVFILTDQTV